MKNADISDQATAYEEQERDALIRAARQTVLSVATGFCFNCEAPVTHDVRFCDADCRDDYQNRQTALVRAGKAFIS